MRKQSKRDIVKAEKVFETSNDKMMNSTTAVDETSSGKMLNNSSAADVPADPYSDVLKVQSVTSNMYSAVSV